MCFPISVIKLASAGCPAATSQQRLRRLRHLAT